jgi:hypothetical protein
MADAWMPMAYNRIERRSADRMSLETENPLTSYQWTQQPAAGQLVKELADALQAALPPARALAQRMQSETGTRFTDWIDHIIVPPSDAIRRRLAEAGFTVEPRGGAPDCYVNRGGVFPDVLLVEGARGISVALKVESVADVAAALGIDRGIDGAPLAVYRKLIIASAEAGELLAVERHGYNGFVVSDANPKLGTMRLHHLERFRTRRREFEDESEGFTHARMLIEAAVADLGRDITCDLFFAAEREFWQRRNEAAQIQKARQDRLGLGWGNHDHHTYRSSREHFAALVAVWELLGLECRERFYAGKEAGWGAQVMEQPVTRIITFNDVDLSPQELIGDFSHLGLPPRERGERLGTVGLWCALHGDSFLQAGMHHLEAQFDFDALRDQLEAQGVKTMKPFTNFAFLRQAFTEGQRWTVREPRLRRLLERGQLTPEQADEFRANGAIGSHLENLERNDGYKGFNQKGVSEIIAATDPRKHQ